MTLRERLENEDESTLISLCNESEYTYSDDRKIYSAYFNGAVQDIDEKDLNREVVSEFIAFLWNTPSFVLAEQKPAQIIAVAIQKGGTGKTTTATAIAQAAAYKNKKVLAVDIDPQGNTSYALRANTNVPGVYEFLHGTPAEEVIQHTEQGIDVIAASWNLSTEGTQKGSATRLKKALEPLRKEYDLIVLDTPTKAGELQYNALYAATGLLIPLEAEAYSLQGLYQIIATAREMQRSNTDLTIKGVLITKWDGRSVLARQMQEQIIIQANKNNVPYLGSIRNGIAVREAAALQQSLFTYAPNSNPAKDYLQMWEHMDL